MKICALDLIIRLSGDADMVPSSQGEDEDMRSQDECYKQMEIIHPIQPEMDHTVRWMERREVQHNAMARRTRFIWN